MKVIILLLIVAVAQSAVPKVRNYLDEGGRLILTPLLEANQIEEAVAQSEVISEKFLGIKSYSGYFTVNKNFNSNLFFWFFPHANNSAPLLLYLQGGPGTSSVFGVFEENGPWQFKNADELELKEITWTKDHSVIFIDNPVGTGYSFSGSEDGYATNETQVGEELYEAMRQFFVMFPDLKTNRFYATGESYAGHYVPALCTVIDKKNQDLPADEQINLSGFAIGSGWTDPINQLVYGDYFYNIGLIDSDARDDINEQSENIKDLVNQGQYVEAAYAFDSIIGLGLTPYKSLIANLTGVKNLFNFIIDKYDVHHYTFVQKPDIRTAIHVGDTQFKEFNPLVKTKLADDIMRSMVPEVTDLLNKGYKALFYDGQVDVIMPSPGVPNFVSKMENWTDIDAYRTAKRDIWYIGDDLAGYSKEAGTLREVLIRNSGNVAPRDQPKRMLDLLLKFTEVEV